MTKYYGISNIFRSHTATVSDLCFSNDKLFSCSHDGFAKEWEWKKHQCDSPCSFVESRTFGGHADFICSILVIPPNPPRIPDGLILTGGSDGKIICRDLTDSKRAMLLDEHGGPVCRLISGGNSLAVLSVSNDRCVKGWCLSNDRLRCGLTITSPKGDIILTVAYSEQYIVAGTYKGMICVYNHDGSLYYTIAGHSSSIRDMIILNNAELITGSNDCSIKKWSLQNMNLLEIMYTSKKPIYSIHIQKNILLSCGESGLCTVWDMVINSTISTINLPTNIDLQKVLMLPNGDIAIGLSEGSIVVYSNEKSRQMEIDIKVHFKSYIDIHKKELFGIELCMFPGFEALKNPGVVNKLRLILEDGDVMAYKWSSDKWMKIGIVTNDSGRRTTVDGVPYSAGSAECEYILIVNEIGSDKLIQLPFNVSQDEFLNKFYNEKNSKKRSAEDACSSRSYDVKSPKSKKLRTEDLTDRLFNETKDKIKDIFDSLDEFRKGELTQTIKNLLSPTVSSKLEVEDLKKENVYISFERDYQARLISIIYARYIIEKIRSLILIEIDETLSSSTNIQLLMDAWHLLFSGLVQKKIIVEARETILRLLPAYPEINRHVDELKSSDPKNADLTLPKWIARRYSKLFYSLSAKVHDLESINWLVDTDLLYPFLMNVEKLSPADIALLSILHEVVRNSKSRYYLLL